MTYSIPLKNIKFSIPFLFSGMALLASIFFNINLVLSLLLFFAPSLLLFGVALSQLNPIDKHVLSSDIKKGAYFGIMGTVAYDAVRLALYSSGAVNFFPFETFRIFGNALAGPSVSYNTAFAIGTLYHALNGITFSIAYRLLFNEKHFMWGVIWALGLEGLMILGYSQWLNLDDKISDFLIVSIVGHITYGTTIGLLNQPKLNMKEVKGKKWATRKNLKVDRVACVWLIRKFIDPDAEILFVEEEQIKHLTEQGVLTFDAEFARYSHDEDYEGGKYGERCTFQILLDEFELTKDNQALIKMGKILNAADIGHRIGVFEPKAGYGLWVIANGFALTTPNDEEKLVKELPIYDAIYAYCENNEV